jgi:hypothetical protein
MHRAIALFLLLTTPLGLSMLSVQEFRSTLTGTVADQSGAMVGHASVAAVNPETQQAFRSETTDSGTYTVTVTVNGFRTREQNNVVLDASTERGLNFVLEVGSTSQAMTVSDTPPLLDTASGSGGTVLTGEEVNAAPLNGRHFYVLWGTTPGSQFTVTTFGPGANSGTRGWTLPMPTGWEPGPVATEEYPYHGRHKASVPRRSF